MYSLDDIILFALHMLVCSETLKRMLPVFDLLAVTLPMPLVLVKTDGANNVPMTHRHDHVWICLGRKPSILGVNNICPCVSRLPRNILRGCSCQALFLHPQAACLELLVTQKPVAACRNEKMDRTYVQS